MARFAGVGSFTIRGTDTRIYDVEMAGAGNLVVTGSSGRVQNCKTGIGHIEVSADRVTVTNCTMFGDAGIEFTGGADYGTISDCYIDVTGVAVSHNTTELVYALLLDNCHLLGSHGISQDSTGIFEELHVGNTMMEVGTSGVVATAERIALRGCSIYDGSGYGVDLSVSALGNRVTVADCFVVGFSLNNVRVTGPEGSVFIHDNFIDSANQHGMVLETDRAVVQGNYFSDNGAFPTNTYDHLTINGDRNLVTGNVFVGSALPRYGVNILGGECNMVAGNDLGDPDDYGTDALNDAGANTQLFWPADATYGDNWTDCGSGS